jgi:hypothetical protein
MLLNTQRKVAGFPLAEITKQRRKESEKMEALMAIGTFFDMHRWFSGLS